ncbi:hypothetical protein QE152_g37354 [Popillia japonica]|uniref:Reverse transcriptase n=1 Tax=Popillia japonica TaxID=7064 RepID=A0AAW1IAH7_POPJA
MYNLNQTIYTPTRITSTSESIIDDIFSNVDVVDSRVIASALSDHHAQQLSIEINEEQRIDEQKYEMETFTPKELTAIREDLNQVDWTLVTSICEVNDSYNKFSEIVTAIMERHIRKRMVNIATKKKWITKKIKDMSTNKRQLYEALIENRVPKEIYIKFCAELKQEIANSKKATYTKYIATSQNPMKATWKIVNHVQGKSQSEKLELTALENKYDSVSNVAAAFNTYFASNCKNLLPDNKFPQSQMEANPNSFGFHLVDTTEIVDAIRSLKNTRAVGVDRYNAMIILNESSKSSMAKLVSPQANTDKQIDDGMETRIVILDHFIYT